MGTLNLNSLAIHTVSDLYHCHYQKSMKIRNYKKFLFLIFGTVLRMKIFSLAFTVRGMDCNRCANSTGSQQYYNPSIPERFRLSSGNWIIIKCMFSRLYVSCHCLGTSLMFDEYSISLRWHGNFKISIYICSYPYYPPQILNCPLSAS